MCQSHPLTGKHVGKVALGVRVVHILPLTPRIVDLLGQGQDCGPRWPEHDGLSLAPVLAPAELAPAELAPVRHRSTIATFDFVPALGTPETAGV